MREHARFQAVVDILEQLAAKESRGETVLQEYFRARRYIGGADRRFVSQTVWDIVRCFGRFRFLKPDVTSREALAAYLFYGQRTAEDIDAVFSGEKFAPAVLTDAEKMFLTRLPETMPDASLEAPEFLKNIIPLSVLTAMTTAAPTDLRVNTLRTTREKVIAALTDQGIDAKETPLSPVGVRVAGRPDIKRTSLFENGDVDFQDEGSQLASLLTRARAGETVADWCAGGGGKTLAMAAMMENKGRIDAVDFYPYRMKELPERLRRAGVKNVRLPDGYAQTEKEYDAVLVDAPCSGTGTWRRFPLLRWRTTPRSVADVVETQAEILRTAATHVRKGGRLIYVTCSVLDVENKNQIESFLSDRPDFAAEDLSASYRSLTGRDKTGPTISLSPDADGTDGFFIASLQRGK